MDKIVHYSKMSKTLEKPRKSFPERWEPSQKKSRFRFAHLWGKWCLAVCPLFGHTKDAAFYCPHFGLLRFTADAYNRPNFGQLPCEPSMGFHAEIRRLHGFPRAERVKTAQNGA